MAKIDEILIDRKSTHGDFKKSADIEQGLKDIFRTGSNWSNMESYKKITLDMIAMKISRILEGDSDFLDHYNDIVGYTTRTIENLNKGK